MSVLDHYDSLTSLLSGGSLTNRVFDTARVTYDGSGNPVYVRDQYVIVYHTTPDGVLSERFTGVASMDSTLEFEWDLRAVGVDARAAAATMQAALARTVGQRLTVAGRSCTPLTVGVAGTVRPDTSVNPPLYYVDASLICVSRHS